jgi:saccharopepsin
VNFKVINHQFEEWTSASCYSVGCVSFGYDGVLGLAPPWNPSLEMPNMLSSLLSQKLLDEPIFSLKLPLYEEDEGEILFGATNPNLHSSDFINLPVINTSASYGQDHDSWTVSASHIHFDSPQPLQQALPANAYAVLDTSSPFLILPANLARNLTAAIGAMRGPYWFKHIPCERRQELPLLTFTLDGHDFSISAFEYTLEMEESLGTICLTTFIAAYEFALPRDWKGILLGHPFLKGFHSRWDFGGKSVGCKPSPSSCGFGWLVLIAMQWRSWHRRTTMEGRDEDD